MQRELDRMPVGLDRYVMLIVYAIAGIMGTLAIAVGPVAALIEKSEGISTSTYSHTLAIVGFVLGSSGRIAGQIADRISRCRVLLWGMIPPIAGTFVFATMP